MVNLVEDANQVDFEIVSFQYILSNLYGGMFSSLACLPSDLNIISDVYGAVLCS